ncbi:MAG: ComEC/Rec2 family competence protein [Cyclobacteriaceae bacterium]
MYFWNSYPFVRLSITLILGILAFDHYPELWRNALLHIFLLIFLLLVSLACSYRLGYYQLRHLNGIIAMLLFFSIGGQLTNKKYRDLPNSHYTHIIEEIDGFSGIVMSTSNERSNHFRYDFELMEVQTNDSTFPAQGTIHLYVRKDTAEQLIFGYGDVLLVSGSFYDVQPPNNPHEFNYKKYLSRQGIYAHCFVQNDQVQKVSSRPSNPILMFAFWIQRAAIRIIDRNIPQPRENGIAKALFLGIKDHLDNEVKKSYSAAGAMHVLAVSGLHVGIVYLFIKFLLGGLKKNAKGRKLFGLIAIFTIWLFALITGLSPSVLRAATMFSIMAISEIRSKKGNIYNTLGVAAFVLLLFDPYLIYSVGFQLSFAAVFGIVYLQPKIYRLINFDSWLPDKAWAITCVSIAAQVSTFPLTAFYFHQFPTYFLISNLVVIPAATIMLVGGIIMMLIDPFSNIIGEFLGIILSKFIWTVNESVSFVESLPMSLIEWIYLDQIGVVLTYAIVLSLIWGLHHRAFQILIVHLILLVSFASWLVRSNHQQSLSHQLIFYEIKGQIAIDHIKGHQSTLFTNFPENEDLELLAFQIDPNRLASRLSPIKETITDLYESGAFRKNDSFSTGVIGGIKILIIDSSTFHLSIAKIIETDVLIIENEAVKSLRWLNEHFQFTHLILGNTNRSFFSRKFKKLGSEEGIVVHSLSLDGALILEL